jgi:hypothetical protein
MKTQISSRAPQTSSRVLSRLFNDTVDSCLWLSIDEGIMESECRLVAKTPRLARHMCENVISSIDIRPFFNEHNYNETAQHHETIQPKQ